MALHSFIAYLKYKWKAKGRHGIHSPFVYDFIDHVLLDKSLLKKEYLINCPALELKYENLLCRIAAYYNCKNIITLPGSSTATTIADILLITSEPKEWENLLKAHVYLLTNESVVIITGIHKTVLHITAWKKLTAGPGVRMSIDLYGLGLLFFKAEFKEVQHFVLKY